MKKLNLIFLLSLLGALVTAAAPPYRSLTAGFEHATDFNGMAAISGGAYNTAIRLDGVQHFAGDSSGASFILAANDTDNQSAGGYKPHRGYIVFAWRNDYLDSGRVHGVALHCPCFIQFRVKEIGVVLSSRGPGKLGDWDSHVTVTDDTTTAWPRVVTTGRNPQGYVYLEHVPKQDSPNDQTYIFQADSINSPDSSFLMRQNKWETLSMYIDNKAVGGYAKLWLNGKLESWALVQDMNGTIAQMHAGLYISAAVPAGSVYNDAFIITEVKDENEAFDCYMATLR